MSGNQHPKTQTEKRRGRPKKIEDSKLDMIMSKYITIGQTEGSQKRKATPS